MEKARRQEIQRQFTVGPLTDPTLLARAVAGEANVPFFNLSGSDFVKMQETIRTCDMNAKQILMNKRDKLEKMARVLLTKEKMDEPDIMTILGPRIS